MNCLFCNRKTTSLTNGYCEYCYFRWFGLRLKDRISFGLLFLVLLTLSLIFFKGF